MILSYTWWTIKFWWDDNYETPCSFKFLIQKQLLLFIVTHFLIIPLRLHLSVKKLDVCQHNYYLFLFLGQIIAKEYFCFYWNNGLCFLTIKFSDNWLRISYNSWKLGYHIMVWIITVCSIIRLMYFVLFIMRNDYCCMVIQLQSHYDTSLHSYYILIFIYVLIPANLRLQPEGQIFPALVLSPGLSFREITLVILFFLFFLHLGFQR